jgi:hypothetical protein
VVEYRLNKGEVSIEESVEFDMLFDSGFCITVEADSEGLPLVLSVFHRTKVGPKRLIKRNDF